MQELEKIFEEIEEATDEYGMVDYINDEPVISKPQAKNIIRKHMSGKDTDVPTNDGWISVDDRLPEEDGTYLCTLSGELCGIEEPFTGMCGIEDRIWDEPDCVLAWRPLPEPYRPERSNDEKK